MAIGFPLVFLSVAAFMTHAVLSRLLSLQREQIAILKAFGFANRQISMHYLKYALVMVIGGTVLGFFGGLFIGHKIVNMYHMFFRFPNLAFQLDYAALWSALLFCAISALGGVLSSVRKASRLPPAEAMRPEPPAKYRPALVERTGIAHFLSHTFRIAVRNVERKPLQALFTVVGLSLATGILVVPNAFRDGVKAILEFQWDVVQRSDISIGLVEPSSAEVVHNLEQIPGVLAIEPFRSAAVRIHYGPRHRQLMVQGYPLDGLHNRVVDASYKLIDMPSHGILISAKLAEVLGVRLGDELTLEFLEGKRPRRNLKLIGLSEDFAGVAAFMEIKALNRLLVEGDIIPGASFKIDAARKGEFLRSLKKVPKVGWVAIKDSLRNNFRKTTGASIGLIQNIYMTFAIVVAFGVVYNNARISLAERARELATLRVIGFSRREVGTVLVTELVILALIAVPLGLWVGKGFATVIIHQVNTETVRVPLVLTANNYAWAVLVVTIASTVSALYVLRMLNQLNLISALKAPE
jgi:putative ABC transport system permease protein